MCWCGRSVRPNREHAVDEVESDRRAVLNRIARVAGGVAAERADRAAVGHDQDRLAVVRCGDPLDRRDDPLGQLLARLAVVPDLASEPAREALREPLADLVAGQARPGADVDLA